MTAMAKPRSFGNWSLPLFITPENKYRMGLLLAVLASTVYLTTNHIHLIEPRLLPMSWLDKMVPFIPETVWIYTSEYVFFVVVYFMCKDMVNLNRYFYAFLALQMSSVLIFTAWPTTYPRDAFPLPEDLDALTYLVFSSLRSADSPANCAPSLHVSSCYLSAFMFLNEQRRKFPFFLLWATAVAVTTMTTKQHYIIDVITGLIMSVIFYWIFGHLFTYHSREAKR